jgi:hypothetical protein
MIKGKLLYDKSRGEYKTIEHYISSVCRVAYSSKYLIANPVLSRNSFSSNILLSIIQGQKINYVYLVLIFFKKLFIYFSKSVLHYLLFIAYYFTYSISNLQFYKKSYDDDVIVFDVFTMIDKIYPNKSFVDPYFGDLYDSLDKKNTKYVMLNVLFGGSKYDFKKRVQTYNILAEDGRNFLTEYELFTFFDYLEILLFIFIYPVCVVRILFSRFGEYDRQLRQELINTLDKVVFKNYIRYVFGKRLKNVFESNIKLLSWFENQVNDKLLIKGIRDSKVTSTIYGCMFFPTVELQRGYFPLKVEEDLNLLPDKICVGGSYYMKNQHNVKINLGFMPRYNHLFTHTLNEDTFKSRNLILVALSYDVTESKRIIEFVKEIKEFINYDIVVKPHPNHLMDNQYELPKSWYLFSKDLSQIANKCIVVIAGGTAAAMELAVLGCSIIIVGKEDGLTLNAMPRIGENIIWKIIFTIDELHKAFVDLINIRDMQPKSVIQLSKNIRDNCFNKSSTGNLFNLFQIEK